MQTSYKRFSVVAGFVVLFLFLVVNASITRRELGVQLANRDWVDHTRAVLAGLSRTESLLRTAEAGQRGFLYTEDTKYLEPYNASIALVEPQVEELAQLTADSPAERDRVPALRTLTQTKLREMAETIAAYRAGRAGEAKALVKSGAGLHTMDQISSLVHEMAREETLVEQNRDALYERSTRRTIRSIYFQSFCGAAGLFILAYFILHEMELRERHARQLREREEWFRVTLTSIGEAVIATDQEGRVTFLNQMSESLLGRKLAECSGRPIEEVFLIFNEYTHEVVENPVKRVVELGHIVGLANHTVLRSHDGRLIPIEDSAAPIRDDQDRLCGVVLVFRDATTGRKAQELLRRTEKLAAAARLSATVAHEINNPLEAVGNLIFITKGMHGLPPGAAENLAIAEQELERVSHITRQTLGFYRESNVANQVELTAIIEAVLRLYSNKLRAKNINVVREFEECPPVQGLSGELKQAVSNLIVNAVDAVGVNGTIRLKVSCVEDALGKKAHLKIEDDGPGIAEELVERIFEPFFTTKEDVGTGLGLWVTKEIVDRHGGTIAVSPKGETGGSGAIFDIQIPCAAAN